MCLGFCFSLWTCPYPHGCGFSFVGGGKVLLALSAWQRGSELLWFVVHAQRGVLISLGGTGCDWLSTAGKHITLNAPVPCCCKHSVLQVTLKHSLRAAIVYSCGVRPVPIKKLVMAYKDEALISVWWYSLGSQLMVRPAWLKRSSYICFCTCLKDFFSECSINRGSCTFFPLHWQHCPCLTPNKS